jgi:hypothetical protein
VSERFPDEPLEPEFDTGLPRRRSEHGGMPRRDDDEFALAAERDRVAAGLEDYAPDDVPPATDPRRKQSPKQSIWRSEGSEAPNRRFSLRRSCASSAMRSAIFASASSSYEAGEDARTDVGRRSAAFDALDANVISQPTTRLCCRPFCASTWGTGRGYTPAFEIPA